MALLRCPVGFSEEIIAAVNLIKSQIETEKDKKIHFSKFLRLFRQIFDRFCGLECFKGSTTKRLIVQ